MSGYLIRKSRAHRSVLVVVSVPPSNKSTMHHTRLPILNPASVSFFLYDPNEAHEYEYVAVIYLVVKLIKNILWYIGHYCCRTQFTFSVSVR